MSDPKHPGSKTDLSTRSSGAEIQTLVSIPNTPWSPEHKNTSEPVERLGDLLKREREKRGDDLQRIADTLCIKTSLLIALENNQYEAFSADAYVIGFLRSYASYLGIDGREAIDRYRHEMAGRRKKPNLVIPSPVTEGNTPSPRIIAGALGAALLVYALWYGISSFDQPSELHPPALPKHVEEAALKTEPPQPSHAQIVLAAAPPPAELLPANSLTTTKTANATSPADSDEQHNAASSSDGAPPPNTNNPANSAKDNEAIPEKPVSTNRILIKAAQPSWMMVMDNRGHTLFDRVLNTGKTYKVPNKKGLTLTTGSSTNLVITVDGVELPVTNTQTDSAHVMHDIPLDPKSLKNLSTKPAD